MWMRARVCTRGGVCGCVCVRTGREWSVHVFPAPLAPRREGVVGVGLKVGCVGFDWPEECGNGIQR